MKFFCKEDISPLYTIAGFDAGFLFVKNNPDKKEAALKVVDSLFTMMDGSSSESVNAMLKQAVMEWASNLKDPLIQMNVMAILSMVQFNLNTPDIPTFSTPEIKAMLTGFKDGAGAVA